MYGQDNQYSVYVNGQRVNNEYLTKEQAERLADSYIEDGYNDVLVTICYIGIN